MCRRYKGTNEFRDRTRTRSCLGLIEQRRRKRTGRGDWVLAGWIVRQKSKMRERGGGGMTRVNNVFEYDSDRLKDKVSRWGKLVGLFFES